MNIAVDQSLQRLRLRYVAPLRRQLGAFWSWWIAELIALLPPNLQAALSQRDQRDFVDLDGDAFVVHRGTMSENRMLTRIPLADAEQSDVALPSGARETVLLLPADRVLVRSITLPLAAEENLREVLSFEMDRQTPFSTDRVYYDCIVTGRNARRKTLSVDLVVTPREIADQLIGKLADTGLHVDILSTRHGTTALPVNLLPRRQRRSGHSAVLRLNTVLAATAVCLFVTAIASPLVQKRQLLRELEPQLIEAVARAEQTKALRQQVEQLVAGSGYLVRKKQQGVLILETLDEVTRILPDHTSIKRLDITESEVQLQGQSSSSAVLISLLESSPALRNVRFRSPVIRIPSTGEERFHLSAEIVKERPQ